MSQFRKQVLCLYKDLLVAAKVGLPKETIGGIAGQEDAINQIRIAFKSNKSLSDPIQIKEQIKKAESSLDFLKMMCPRSFVKEMERKRGQESAPTSSFIVVDGQIVEGNSEKKKLRDFVDKRIDEVDIKKYHQQIQRAKKLGLYEI